MSILTLLLEFTTGMTSLKWCCREYDNANYLEHLPKPPVHQISRTRSFRS